jgi:hypothetical protein
MQTDFKKMGLPPAQPPMARLTSSTSRERNAMSLSRTLCSILIASLPLFAAADDKVYPVSARIIDPVTPDVRGSKYEGPLDAALKEAKLGEVVGGGNSVTKQGKIEWVGVDIELSDLTKGIPFLKEKLRELGAPAGSTLDYHAGNKKVSLAVGK